MKAFIFDAYGTLFDVHAPVARVSAKLGDKAQAVSDLWRMKQLNYSWLRGLMGEYVPFWQVTREALDYALAAHGIDDEPLRNELADLYFTLDAYDDAIEALDGLKAAGKVTGILSNGSRDMLDAAVAHSGLDKRLDHVLSIDAVGVYKPDPRVYQLVPDTLEGIAPGETCFVSANTWDAQAASHFGFYVCRIDRFGLIDEVIPGKPDRIVKSLAELLALV